MRIHFFMGRMCQVKLSPKTRSRVARKKSAFSLLNGMGGLIFKTLCIGTVGADQDAQLTHAVDDKVGFRGRRLQRPAVLDQFRSQEKPAAAHVADNGKAGGEPSQSRQQAIPHRGRMLHQPFFAHDPQHGLADGAGYGIAAEGAEEFHAVVESGRDFGTGDHGTERMAVADRLAQDDDIGQHVLFLKGVKMAADPAISRLHFIGDAYPAGLADVAVDRG